MAAEAIADTVDILSSSYRAPKIRFLQAIYSRLHRILGREMWPKMIVTIGARISWHGRKPRSGTFQPGEYGKETV
jgi:hypothetical protein